MKLHRLFISTLGIVVAVCGIVLPTYAVVSPSNGSVAKGNGFVKVKNSQSAGESFVPGQIILKVKEHAAMKKSLVPFANTPAGNQARLDAMISGFGSFKKRHGVRLTSHLFTQGAEERARTGTDLFADQPTHVNKIKSLYRQRSQRAPGNAITPRIDNVFLITLNNQKDDILSACKELAADTSVEYAVPNTISRVQLVPNDPLYQSQWAHKITGAEQAWDIERGKNDVVVAIVDCGIDYTHEDLADNMLGGCSGGCPPNTGYDFVDIDTALYKSWGLQLIPGEDFVTPDNDPMDFNGHGTHCAGIVAAVADNGVGVSGVAPHVKLMPVRAGFSIKDGGNNEFGALESDDIANAIRYAADNGADVISMSFGGGADSLQHDAIEYAASLGVVLVAAAGNSNSTEPSYPGAYDHVISVAATSQSDNRAYYSNFGSWVDIAAPGGDMFSDEMIMSTVPRTGGVLSSPTGYRQLQGTSMAAPYVAGVAALVISRDPTRTAEEVESILKQSVDMPKSNVYIGTGRINVNKAVQAMVVHASATIESPTDGQHITSTSFPIIGSITSTGSVTYKVFIGNGLYPDSWNLISGGDGPVLHSTLATSDESTADGIHTIKTVAYADADSVVQFVRVLIEKTKQTGWPTLDGNGCSNTPILSDLDGDGVEDVIIGTMKGIWAFRGDGTVLPGWPVEFTPGGYQLYGTNGVSASPAVADIDGDGKKEVVMVGISSFDYQDSLFVFNSDGTRKPGFPVALHSPNPVLTTVTLADLDNNGSSEIILSQKAKSSNNKSFDQLLVFNADGTPFQKWPAVFNTASGDTLWINGASATHVLAFDIDNDGKKELIINACRTDVSSGTRHFLQQLYVFNFDGTLREGFPVEYPQSFVENGVAPVAADINNDGITEIGLIMDEGGMVSNGMFLFVKPDGTPLDGWPVEFPCQLFSSGVSFADMDHDGSIETIFGTYSDPNGHGRVSILNSQGTQLTSWPQMTDAQIASPTITADINSDGYPEVIAVDINGKVYAWTNTGVSVPGFPKSCSIPGYSSDYFSGCPAVGDINGDGKLELVVSSTSGKIFVWGLSGNNLNSGNQWPMDFHDPMHSSDLHTGCNAIKILTQPGSITVIEPAPVTFNVTVSGTDPSYQWQISTDNGASFTSIPGANASSYTIDPTTTSMNGNYYRCIISNNCPSQAISAPAKLTVNCNEIKILTQPGSVTTIEPAPVTFNVTVSGAAPSYQWQVSTNNGASFTSIPGANASSYTIDPTTPSMNGNYYRCIISNSCPSQVTSASAKLTVNCNEIKILTQPGSITAIEPAPVTFNVTVSGTALSYQWQVSTDNGASFTGIPGANASSYTIDPTTPSMNGNYYRCLISNNCQSVATSASARLTVNCKAVTILTQPTDVTISASSSATFSVTTDATSPTFQWQLSTDYGTTFSAISGANSAAYSTGPTTAAMNGYCYRCVITNRCGISVNTSSAMLKVKTLQKLTGTAFGTSPAYATGREYNMASDGNTTTYFDFSQASGGYTGIDLGAGVAKRIEKIRYYPRPTFASRMVGGKFQGSNSSSSGPYTDLCTISSTPATSWNEISVSNTSSWRYLRYIGPANAYCNIAEMEFYANEPTNNAPKIITPAAANTNPVIGTSAILSVLGADDGGEGSLVYTWATTGTPPASVTFSTNGNNAAKNCTATFTKAGSYSLQVTIKDPGNLTITSPLTVTVNQILTSIVVSPASAPVYTSASQQFTATARDQFAASITTQPVFAWSVSGGGTITQNGLFTAGSSPGGPYTVTASSGDKSGTAGVTILLNFKVESENTTLSGGAKKNTNHNGYSGTGFVDGYYSSTTAKDSFTVNVSSAGTYKIKVHYSAGNGTSTNTGLYVNGLKNKNISCNATANWDTWADETETVTLKAGNNGIVYKAESSNSACINLDYFNVTQ